VSLDSIAYAFIAGHSAETIAQSFPLLTLEQVYGAIAFYLRHCEEIDRYLEAQGKDYEAKRDASRAADPEFYAGARTPAGGSPHDAVAQGFRPSARGALLA